MRARPGTVYMRSHSEILNHLLAERIIAVVRLNSSEQFVEVAEALRAGGGFTKHFRNPLKLRWHKSLTFDHQFRGKAALQNEAANPTRQTASQAEIERGGRR